MKWMSHRLFKYSMMEPGVSLIWSTISATKSFSICRASTFTLPSSLSVKMPA